MIIKKNIKLNLDTWPKRKDGLNSTSGTTATVILLRGDKMYIAHVGDSAAAICNRDGKKLVGKELTRDHKPEDLSEKARYVGILFVILYLVLCCTICMSCIS